MIAGLGIFLVLFVSAFSAGNDTATIALIAALSVLFASLIYFQLRFYREGDSRHVRSHGNFTPADIALAPDHLKSPHHRAIWENMEQMRNLMRRKEREFLQAEMKNEKRAIGLPQEEEIVFMADRSRFYIWLAAPVSLAFLFISTSPSKGLSQAFSFTCLILGLLGLLLLTAARFPNRYYMTNFRILIREKWPLKKEQWSAVDYREISAISRKKKPISEHLTLKSGGTTIKIQGLSKQKLETMLGILRQNCSFSRRGIPPGGIHWQNR